VFQSAPISLQLGIRKYFLPIVRVLQLFPLLSECAVGVNCQGPEWDELMTHAFQFGDDTIIAGDYANYDITLSAQTTLACFDCLINFAVASGNYTEDDIQIMRGIATDVSSSLIAFDGVLLMMNAINPSGQNITVIVNGTGGSLNARACAKREYPELKDFRKMCALITYGDDNIGSVHKSYPKFNHISMAEFAKSVGMVYTMPDKTSAPVSYLDKDTIDFLKRKSVWNEKLGLKMAALDEKSIFKSLHANLRSTALSKTELSIQTIDGALREWFFHGEEVYEKRRAQMTEVCGKAGIIAPQTFVSYAAQERVWLEKYRPETPEEVVLITP
jgi:hypothetical protein